MNPDGETSSALAQLRTACARPPCCPCHSCFCPQILGFPRRQPLCFRRDSTSFAAGCAAAAAAAAAAAPAAPPCATVTRGFREVSTTGFSAKGVITETAGRVLWSSPILAHLLSANRRRITRMVHIKNHGCLNACNYTRQLTLYSCEPNNLFNRCAVYPMYYILSVYFVYHYGGKLPVTV